MKYRRLLITLLMPLVAAGYLLLQFVGPANEFALTPNFDTSCYSGSFSLIERVSDQSSCGASSRNAIGFPFVFNFQYNPAPLNYMVLIFDMLPLIVLIYITARYISQTQP